jgi:hypothetical protein
MKCEALPRIVGSPCPRSEYSNPDCNPPPDPTPRDIPAGIGNSEPKKTSELSIEEGNMEDIED